jgi:hypothetical protein
MLGITPAEMLTFAKAISLVALVLLCVADPWWLRISTLLRNVPHFDL